MPRTSKATKSTKPAARTRTAAKPAQAGKSAVMVEAGRKSWETRRANAAAGGKPSAAATKARVGSRTFKNITGPKASGRYSCASCPSAISLFLPTRITGNPPTRCPKGHAATMLENGTPA